MSIKLQNQEQIVHIARRHGSVYLRHWFLAFIFITTPFFSIFWLFRHDWWGQIIFFVSLGVGFLILIRAWFLWRKNSAIITTERVIDVDQRGIFDKIVTEISYDDLDYASGQIRGFWGTILRYGQVNISSEINNINIILEKIKQPAQAQELINKLRKNYNRRGADFVCTECGMEENGIFNVLNNKLRSLEIEELIRLKKAIDKKLSKLLDGKKR